ncbi:MAG: tetratricopeptide repeat protein [bacterium]|nr:tetratricopeptide repeat protein [bacterium]
MKKALIALALTSLCVTVSPLPSQANWLGDFGGQLVDAIGQSINNAGANQQAAEHMFEQGVQAFKNQEYRSAVESWTHGAKWGHARSQHALGVCYLKGIYVNSDVQQAFSLFQAAAKGGLAEAQTLVGQMYLQGTGTDKNYKEAFKWLSKAAKQNHTDAYKDLGICYYKGFGTEVKYDKATQYLLPVAEKGDDQAQAILAQIYLNEQNPHHSPSEALKWLDKAAEADNAEAKTILAEQCLINNQGQYTAEKGVKLLKEAAKADIEKASVYLSLCYLSGYGTEQNIEKGVQFLNSPAKDGNSLACDLLQALADAGIIDAQESLKAGAGTANTSQNSVELNKYRDVMAACAQTSQGTITPNVFVSKCLPDNRGVLWPQDKDILTKEDASQAITAAELGNSSAQTALGLLYASDKEINPLLNSNNKSESAFKWFNRAAQQDNITAQTNLGICYLEGNGTAKDTEKAVALLRGSAAAGDALAKHHLGQCYAQGIGVKQDSQEAQKLLGQASSQGISASKEALGNIAKEQGMLYIPAEIYTNTKQYDNLKPYDAFTRGKQACEKGNPQGYALLESSARRGCNHAKLYLAYALLPHGHKLSKDSITFNLEGKDWSGSDRMQRYLKWMSSAADNGSLEACQNLRKVYKGGFGVEKDSAKIFQYTKAAAQLKDSDAMFDLGERYAKGVGCQKDRAAAVKWMKQAAHACNDEAKQWIEDRRGHMISVEIPSYTANVDVSHTYDDIRNKFISNIDKHISSWSVDLRKVMVQNGGLASIAQGYALRDGITADLFYDTLAGTKGTCDIYGIIYNVVPKAVNGIYDSVILKYGGETLTLKAHPNVVDEYMIGAAVGLRCIYKYSDITALLKISGPEHSKQTVYKTVKKWQGPKIGGWEDLLK